MAASVLIVASAMTAAAGPLRHWIVQRASRPNGPAAVARPSNTSVESKRPVSGPTLSFAVVRPEFVVRLDSMPAAGELIIQPATTDKITARVSDGFGTGGSETVEFLVATNPGIPASPLRDAASGGELSRIMLALTGLGAGGGAGTVVFDEIDAGIGGNTARAVGEKLRGLGAERQLICITHLPQVASVANAHFRIVKESGGKSAQATVERVDGDELVAEIVRMLGGKRDDETASRHARELLAAA